MNGMTRRDRWMAIAVPTVLMFVVGCWGVVRGSLWRDEGITKYVSRLPFGQFVHAMRNVDVVHMLYYLIIRATSVFGSSEFVLRLPSVLAMAGAVACTAALGIRLSGNVRVGLTAGLVLVAAPFVSHYAQEARSYALVCLLVSVANLLLVIAFDAGWRAWVGYGVALWVAITLNELAALVVLAHLVTVLIVRRSVRRWLVATFVALVAATPLVLYSLQQEGRLPPRSAPKWHAVATEATDLFGAPWWVKLVLGALAVVGLLSTSRARLSVASVAAPVLLVPVLVLFVVAQVKPELWDERYTFFAVTGMALLVGAGLDRLLHGLRSMRWSVLVVAVFAVALFLVQLPGLRAVRGIDGRPDDMAGAAAYVHRYARPGDAVLFLPRNYRTVRLAYPSDFTGLDDVALRRSPQSSGTLRGLSASRTKLRARLTAAQRVWTVGKPSLASGPDVAAARSVLTTRFHIVKVDHVHGLTVQLWERAA